MQSQEVPSDALVALLDAVEGLEEPLLSWGVTSVGLPETEVEALAKQVAKRFGPPVTADKLLDAAEDSGALYFDDVDDCVRSRGAETIRLLVHLRQLVHGPDGPPHWSSRPSLVRDFRFERRIRSRPARDRRLDDVAESVKRLTTPRGLDALRRQLTWPDGTELRISGFQQRAIQEVLAAAAAPQASAVMISAGTGAGKTKAFYLPAFAHLATLMETGRWTKAIGIYPRIELLKDQFTEAFAQARLLDDLLVEQTGRKLILAAYYGDVPYSERSPLRPSWRKAGRGRICPFLRCPTCDGDMIRYDDRPQELRCQCGFTAGPDVIALDREAMAATPPDVLFMSGEMLNRSLGHNRHRVIVGIGAVKPPQLVLLDEVHTYGGASGAQTALLLRRWAHAASARPTYVGLSATLRDPQAFLSQITGVARTDVVPVAPLPEEMEATGREYLLALRNDAAAGTSVLSTTIQTCMLLARCLDRPATDADLFGSKLFAFTDNLDVTNRLYSNLCDAEGRFIWDKPIPNQESLATLRHPAADRGERELRHRAGQSWSLPLSLGHDLSPGSALRLGRVHAKDAGVSKTAQVVVATSSLEVGFDDPEVGAVVQHGAPRDVAQFLQRKGRAGRDIAMRPWTVVVLSEYGRDRFAYQGWDLLFDPELPPKHLPVHNAYLLRIHAAACLMDWLLDELGSSLSRKADLWRVLAGPAEPGPFYEHNRGDQVTVLTFLRQLLEDTALQERLAGYVGTALQLDRPQVDELLWYPPRSVMLTAVPALIRRLATEWEGERGRRPDPDEDRQTPLPEHMSANLFSALELPEVDIHAERKGGDFTFEESLPFDRAMREFCPGNVSRRAATSDQVASHWVPVPDLHSYDTQTLDPSLSFDGLERLETLEFSCSELRCASGCPDGPHPTAILRPSAVRVDRTPRGLSPSSRAFPLWSSRLSPQGTPWTVDLPGGEAAVVRRLDFHLHADGSHVSNLRVVSGADGSAVLDGDERRYRVRFGTEDELVALGVRATADACRLEVEVPGAMASVDDLPAELLRSVRAAWLRHRFEVDLDPYANRFKAGWLHDAAIAALAVAVALEGHADPQAAYNVIDGTLPDRMLASLDVLFERVDADLELGGGPRRVRDGLALLLQDGALTQQISQTVRQLWEPLGADATDWMHERLSHTYGVAVLHAARHVCRDHDPEGVILDVMPGDGGPELWLVETTPGGIGLLEALAQRVGDDPRNFERGVRNAVAPSDAAQVDDVMGSCLPELAQGGALARAAKAFREADGGSEKLEALRLLRHGLEERGLPTTHSAVAALTARVLRPGTGPATDALVHDLVADRRAFEAVMGIEVDNRIWSFIASQDRKYEALGGPPGRQGRHDAIESVLWRRGWEAEADGLSCWSPYTRLLPSAPNVLRHRMDEAATLIDAKDADALVQVLQELQRNGVAQVLSDGKEPGAVAELLSRLMAETVDLDVLRARPRLSTVERRGSSIRATVELPEVI